MSKHPVLPRACCDGMCSPQHYLYVVLSYDELRNNAFVHSPFLCFTANALWRSRADNMDGRTVVCADNIYIVSLTISAANVAYALTYLATLFRASPASGSVTSFRVACWHYRAAAITVSANVPRL